MRFNNGADTRIRPVDLLITSQLLYQLSYAGAFLVFRTFRIGTVCSLAKLTHDASSFFIKTAKNL